MNKLSSAYKFNGGDEMEESISMYSTFYRGYDQQLGRFMGVDMRSEEAIGMSGYHFSGNNPIMLNDPLGDKEENPLAAAVEAMFNSPYGGSWNAKNGVIPYASDYDVFLAGATFMTMNNLWGQGGGGGGGFASSFAAAKDAYYNKYGGTDPNIRNMIEPIIVRGNIRNNQWVTTSSEADIVRQLRDRGYLVPEAANGWNVAGHVLETSGMAWDLTRNGFNGAQRLANTWGNTSYVIQDLGKLKLLKGVTFELAGKVLGGVSVGIAVIDIGREGLNWSNGTDLGMAVVSFVPIVGWVISGSYFVVNGVVEQLTGKSLGQHLGDALHDPEISSSYQHQAQFPDF
jgi:RHS repeat-associated protein